MFLTLSPFFGILKMKTYVYKLINDKVECKIIEEDNFESFEKSGWVSTPAYLTDDENFKGNPTFIQAAEEYAGLCNALLNLEELSKQDKFPINTFRDIGYSILKDNYTEDEIDELEDNVLAELVILAAKKHKLLI